MGVLFSHDASWEADALCQQIGDTPRPTPFDPDATVFFPGIGSTAREGKRICGMCDVRPQCLDAVMDLPAAQDHGIRGGLTEKERRALRRALTTTATEPADDDTAQEAA